MNPFDKAARYAAKLDPPGFFNWLFRGLECPLVFQDWLDTRTIPYPGEPDRTCDTVAGFVNPAEPNLPFALVVEFKSEPEGGALEQLLEYVIRLRRELRHGPQRQGRYQVGGALLNLTGPTQPDVLQMPVPGRTNAGLHFQVVLRTLRDQDAATLLGDIVSGQIARCMLSWIPLMQGASELGIINRWKVVAETEPNSWLRSMYGGLALVFADLAGCITPWKSSLEGWNMRESQIVLEWKQEGMVEAKRETLLHALEVRLANPVPADLAQTVTEMSDLSTLSRWFDAALKATTLEEFRAVVHQAPANGQ